MRLHSTESDDGKDTFTDDVLKAPNSVRASATSISKILCACRCKKPRLSIAHNCSAKTHQWLCKVPSNLKTARLVSSLQHVLMSDWNKALTYRSYALAGASNNTDAVRYNF